MSIKCQYQAPNSNLIWWIWEKCKLIIRIKLVIKKIVPIITCKPWNPVAI
jgi:hypothetical protein